MKARNENLTSIDAIMDAEFGKPGTPEREEFRKEAYAYCMGQIICDARKKEKMRLQKRPSTCCVRMPASRM